MGFWAGIKHALNSTLGTADFKPLDVIMDNIMYKYTLGSKQYIADSTVIIKYLSSEQYRYVQKGEEIVLGNFIPSIGGYIRFNYKITSGKVNGKSQIQVYDKTENVTIFQNATYLDFPSINGQQLFADIKVASGHLYEITFSYTDSDPERSQGSVAGVFISGSVSEAPLYDYTIGG